MLLLSSILSLRFLTSVLRSAVRTPLWSSSTPHSSCALFKGAADMQQQLSGSAETLDSTRELALV